VTAAHLQHLAILRYINILNNNNNNNNNNNDVISRKRESDDDDGKWYKYVSITINQPLYTLNLILCLMLTLTLATKQHAIVRFGLYLLLIIKLLRGYSKAKHNLRWHIHSVQHHLYFEF